MREEKKKYLLCPLVTLEPYLLYCLGDSYDAYNFFSLGNEVRNKQVPKLGETIALEKAHIAYLDQLETTYSLSKELETIKNQLADTEKSLKVREGEIHAKDKELRAKDKQIKALKKAATDAVKKFTKSRQICGSGGRMCLEWIQTLIGLSWSLALNHDGQLLMLLATGKVRSFRA